MEKSILAIKIAIAGVLISDAILFCADLIGFSMGTLGSENFLNIDLHTGISMTSGGVIIGPLIVVLLLPVYARMRIQVLGKSSVK